MKINSKIYRSLTDEPVKVQDLDGRRVEFHYMNDTPYYSQYIPRGRFYLWTSDGKDYKLLVEKGFYERVSYFFDEDINEIWIDFLEDLGKTHSRNNRIFLFSSMGLTLLVLILAMAFFQKYLTAAIIVTLVLTLVVNTIHTTRTNKMIKEKNYEAQEKIRTLLTEDGFNKLIDEQELYMKEFYAELYKDDEENNDDELDLIDGDVIDAEVLESNVEVGDEVEIEIKKGDNDEE